MQNISSRSVKNVMSKIHPNLWDCLKKKYNEGCEDPIGADCCYQIRNISDVFPAHMVMIKGAIENKQDYTCYKYSRHHAGRDFSLELKMCKDGVYRGWFSSEYHGCGNGDYYILIDFNKAVFVEKD